jgi:polyhydroxyalkanoate synthase
MLKKAPESPRPVPMTVDLGAYRIANAEEFGRNMLRLMEEGGKVMSGLFERANGKLSPMNAASDLTEAGKLFGEIAQHWAADPVKLVEAQGELWRDFLRLGTASLQRLMGGEAGTRGGTGTRRQSLQGSRLEQQSLLRFLEAVLPHHHALARRPLERDRGLDERTRQRAEFYLKQLASALSPSNFR